MSQITLYECGICDCLHPANWSGDCRDDANRYFDSLDYAERNHIDDDDVEVVECNPDDVIGVIWVPLDQVESPTLNYFQDRGV